MTLPNDQDNASASAPSDPLSALAQKGVRPVHVDGALYAAIGLLTAFLAAMATDQAVKFVPPMSLFWIKTVAESLNGMLLAIKMFRSTSYGDSKKS